MILGLKLGTNMDTFEIEEIDVVTETKFGVVEIGLTEYLSFFANEEEVKELAEMTAHAMLELEKKKQEQKEPTIEEVVNEMLSEIFKGQKVNA